LVIYVSRAKGLAARAAATDPFAGPSSGRAPPARLVSPTGGGKSPSPAPDEGFAFAVRGGVGARAIGRYFFCDFMWAM
jgi:hypothetical protein